MIVVTACGGSGRSPDEVEILSIPDRFAVGYTDDSTGEFGVAVDLQRINGAWLIVKIVLREL